MAEASVEYVSLSETASRKHCFLGLTVGSMVRGKRGREYRDLHELTVCNLKDKKVTAREPILAGDIGGAASRLLKRLR